MKGKRILKRVKDPGSYITLLLIVVSVWFEIRLILFGMMEAWALYAAAGLLLLLDGFLAYLMLGSKYKWSRRFMGYVLGIVLSLILALCSAGMQVADSFLNSMTTGAEVRRDISVVALKDSPLESVSDLTSDTVVGYEVSTAAEGTKNMLAELEKKTASLPKEKEYDNVNALINGLYAKETDAVILNESFRNLLLEERENFNEETKVLYSISYSEPQKNISRKIDVTSEPFLVMISGIDTYGPVDTVSRSDVNILAAVDPVKARILLISIPRDYYVPIIAGTLSMAGPSGSMDKLTHSGLFGPECTVRTVENLFDTEINYYVKVNFTGVVDIVDALGGITVQSEYAFDEFQAGSNQLNGEKALAFARNRYAFADGDRQRGKNQMKVIEGIIQKITNVSLDYDYAALVNSVSGSVEMNFSDTEVKQLIQLQTTRHPSWSVESISVTGTDGNDYSYFYGSNLYVMYPDETSVNAAKEKLQEILLTP